jgi:hypothetical protein
LIQVLARRQIDLDRREKAIEATARECALLNEEISSVWTRRVFKG